MTTPAAIVNAPRVVLVTAPAEEPVSAAELKLHVKVDHDDDDTLIDIYIASARRTFEALTGRSLVATVWRVEWDGLPRAGSYAGAACSRELRLPRVPMVSVDWLKYLDEDGDEQTVAAADYTVDTGLDPDRPGRLWLNSDADWPDLGDFPGALRCQFTAGYGAATAVPEEIKAAILLLAAHLYENRLPVNTGNIVTEIPFTLQTLITMHRVDSLG